MTVIECGRGHNTVCNSEYQQNPMDVNMSNKYRQPMEKTQLFLICRDNEGEFCLLLFLK